jgi:hypothetical protein
MKLKVTKEKTYFSGLQGIGIRIIEEEKAENALLE